MIFESSCKAALDSYFVIENGNLQQKLLFERDCFNFLGKDDEQGSFVLPSHDSHLYFSKN